MTLIFFCIKLDLQGLFGTVPLNNHCQCIVCTAGQAGSHIGSGVNSHTVNGLNGIAHLQSGGCAGGIRLKLSHLGSTDQIAAAHNQHGQQKAQHQIHQRTGHHHKQPSRYALFVKGVGVFRVLPLALHLAIAAKKDPAQGELGAVPFPLYDLRAHTHGKLIDFDLHEPSGNIMPALMHQNDQFKK